MFFSIFEIFYRVNMYWFIPISFVLLILLISSFYDLKFGIIPNILSKLLIIFGIIFNLSLCVIYDNYYFLIDCLIMTVIIFIVSFLLWKIKFWGGGDLKIFTGMSLALTYFSSPLFISLKILPYMEQNFFYFPIFSILFNALLISFPFLIIYLFVNYLKENYNSIKESYIKDNTQKNHFIQQFNIYLNIFKFFIFNFKKIIYMSSKKRVKLSDLEEGMILDKYLFRIENLSKFILDLLIFISSPDFNHNDINLEYGLVKVDLVDKNKTTLDIKELLKNKEKIEIKTLDIVIEKGNENELLDNIIENKLLDNVTEEYKNNLKYISSDNGMGLTSTDILIINYLYEKEHFKNPEFIIKKSVPFIPSLTIGYIIFLIFGDLINIITNFLSSLF